MYREKEFFENVCILENIVTTSSTMAHTHWHNFYELLYVRQGTARQQMNENNYLLEEGHIIFIPPHVVHSTTALLGGCNIMVILFHGENLEIAEHREGFVLPRSDYSGYPIDGILKTAQEEYQQKYAGYATVVKGCLIQLIAYLTRLSHSGSVSFNRPDKIWHIKDYVNHHIEDNLSLQDASRRFGYTPQHLTTLFKEYTGCTFKAYVNQEKVAYAIKLLLFENIPIKLIAQRLGYTDAASFSRLFKSVTGYSPRDYAKYYEFLNTV